MENKIITFAVVGAGGRAMAYLNALEKYFPNNYKVVAIADPDKEKQKLLKSKYNLKDEMIFENYQNFIKQPKLADVVIIGTLDDMHYVPAMDAIKKDYHLILEKPIAMSIKEVVEIGLEAKKHPDKLVAVCHVLRFTSFFKEIKRIIDSKELGNIVNIQHNENVGYYHFAHSYVRGSWRNTAFSAPFIVAKSCHDMDIMLYLLGDKKCKKLSSMGSLSFFNSKNYNEKIMAKRCIDCSINKTCPYSAIEIYNSGKIKSMVFDLSSEEKIRETFKTSPYGRCVFACDNNVPDHQVTAIEFEDGVTATFNLSAFTNTIHRSLKIMCQYGEIRATETTREIEVQKFGSNEKITYKPQILGGGHGGGDEGIVISFMNSILYGKKFDSTIDMSIESHVMAYAAEESRLGNGQVIDIPTRWKQEINELISERSIYETLKVN